MTKARSSFDLAALLFDEVLVPLAAAGNSRYFEFGRNADEISYYSCPPVGVMAVADLEHLGQATAEELIDALMAYWAASGEPELTVLAKPMRSIAKSLQDEQLSIDGTVSIFCYAMF